MKTEDTIRRSPFFQGLSEKNNKALAEICRPLEVKKKQSLFLQGTEGEGVFLLARGSIGLYKNSQAGKEVAIRIIKPGEIFAEVILFGDNRYPVTAAGIEDSYVYMIPREKFHTLLDHQDFRNDFIFLLLKKQRYLANQILYLTSHDVEERFFLFLKEHFGEAEKIIMNYTKKDVAAAISTTPETFSRLLQRLKKTHILEWKDRELIFEKNYWKGK